MQKQLVIVMGVLFLIMLGFGVIIPVLPVYVQQTGATATHLGLMLAGYSAMQFLFAPMWGKISDRVGRKPILLIGILGFSISFFLFGLTTHLWLLYVSRLVGGFFSGAALPVALAIIADITTDENRTRGMGFAGMSIGLGFILGPAIGGGLSHFGNATPFFASAILALVTFTYAFFVLPESLSAEERAITQAAPKVSRWKAFAGSLKFLYVITFIITFSLAGLESTFQYFEMKKMAVTPTIIGIMFLVMGVVSAGAQGGLVRRLMKTRGEVAVMQIGLVLSAIGFIIITVGGNLVLATAGLAIFGAGNGMIRPCVTSLITQKTTVGKGAATGLASSMDSLGRIIGPLLATSLFEIESTLPFITGAVFSLIAIVVLYKYMVADRQELKLNEA